MTEYVVSAVVSAVVDEGLSFLAGKWNDHKNVCERIDRIEKLATMIQCAVDTSELYDINNESLRKLQRGLKEALSEAEEILGLFKVRAPHAEASQTTGGELNPLNTSIGLQDAVNSMQPVPHLTEDGTFEVLDHLPHPSTNGGEQSDATLAQPVPLLTEDETCQIKTGSHLPNPSTEEERLAAILLQTTGGEVSPLNTSIGVQDAVDSMQPVPHVTKDGTFEVEVLDHLPHPSTDGGGQRDATLAQPVPLLTEDETRQTETDHHSRNISVGSLMLLGFMLLLPRAFVEKLTRIQGQGTRWISRMTERATKVKNCMEKLEKTAGDLGNFLFMLKQLSKRKMNRKRKRSGVALLGLFFSFLRQTSPEAILCCFGQLLHTRLMELVLHTVFIQSESPVNSSVGFIIVSQNNLAIISVIIN